MGVLWLTNGPELLGNSKGRQILTATFSRSPRTLGVISIESEKRRGYGCQTQECVTEIQSNKSLSIKIEDPTYSPTASCNH